MSEWVRSHYLCLLDRTKHDSMLFMGTTYPYNTWVVIGVYYPPKLTQDTLV